MKQIDVSLSKARKKAKNSNSKSELRSVMLKAIMPELSGERGERLARAFQDGDKHKIRALLLEVVKNLT